MMSSEQLSYRRFGSDALWNFGSLAFLASAGIVLNVILGGVYGASVLGVFNVVFAIYIFASQFGVLGLHLSVLKVVSIEYGRPETPDLNNSVIIGAVLVLLISTTVSFLVLICVPLLQRVYEFDGFSTMLYCIVPGLWAFALNKYFLSIVNGTRKMRAFAIFQSLRYVFILLGTVVFLIFNADPNYFTLVISFSELILLFILFIFCSRTFPFKSFRCQFSLIQQHLRFGTRVFLSGVMGELNTRVDVLMIGAFLNERSVGIYTISVLIAEGLYQSVVVVRNVINPVVARSIADGTTEQLSVFLRKVSLGFSGLMIFGAAVCVLVFPYAVDLAFGDGGFEDAFWPLVALTIGLVVAAPYLPLSMVFSQGGRPTLQAGFTAFVLAVNAIFNLVLIPQYGIVGAGIATGLSYVFGAVMIAVIARREFGVRVWM
jgi:O-antigen/teichoic acid export membrane protein